ncbi:hypothetical protein ACFQX6_08845 [Streptosporangium lutulentum]
MLGMTVLFVAPFLHGSARNQAFQAEAAAHATSLSAELPKIPAKQVSASTWTWGTAETLLVIAAMAAATACRDASPGAGPRRPPPRQERTRRPRRRVAAVPSAPTWATTGEETEGHRGWRQVPSGALAAAISPVVPDLIAIRSQR